MKNKKCDLEKPHKMRINKEHTIVIRTLGVRISMVCSLGGDKRIRTAGLLVANEALYQLSHIPNSVFYYISFSCVCQRFFIEFFQFLS